ncbi:MAG: LysR substrate-binding domain-containing protein [Solimonas sp.]
MELRQLRYFIAVAEELNFSRAAQRLHVSQPPLSTQIMNLEAELGTRLFERGNRGVALTAAGAAFVDEARAVLARLEHGRALARQVGLGEAGTLSIGFVSIADYGILPPALKDFRSRLPQVEVQLRELTTDAQIRELRASRLDLGIALGPVNEPGLGFQSVQSEALIAALPSARRLKPGTVDLRTLAGESFIVPPRDIAPGLHDLIVRHCHNSGFTPRITQHARQMQTVVSLVAAGMGVALVPSSMQNLRRSGVQYRRLTGQARGRQGTLDIGTLTAQDEARPLVRHFREALMRAAAPLH